MADLKALLPVAIFSNEQPTQDGITYSSNWQHMTGTTLMKHITRVLGKDAALELQKTAGQFKLDSKPEFIVTLPDINVNH